MIVAPPLPPSTLLVPGKTLLFLPSLVSAIGINEAIALQQIRYRLADERAPRLWEGQRWVRASVQTWRERDFPFWSDKTIRRTFESLERQGLVHTAQPDLARRDGTKWYTINFVALEPLAKLTAGQGAGRGAPKRSGATTGTSTDGERPPLPVSDLLLPEPPLVILVDLAVRIGLDEALILQQLRYWLADERKPPVRDGRRWVCPSAIEFFDPLTHRSTIVLERTLRQLERDGLVRASSRYNAAPGDRTKWYTIEFDAVARLMIPTTEPQAPRQTHDLTTSKRTEWPSPAAVCDQFGTQVLSTSSGPDRPHPATRSDQIEADEMANSLKGSKTDPKTEPQIQQQQGEHVVVNLHEALCERGITAAVARHLCATNATASIARQIEAYDWLGNHPSQASRATPGRLRRMIEEDWQPPHEYRPTHETTPQTTSAEAHDVQTSEATREAMARREERDRIIAELGLDRDDQRRWSHVVASSPVLPPPFREALFRAPSPGTAEPALLIFADSELRTRALGAAHRASRATVAARLAMLCRRPALPVEYLDLPTLREALTRPDDDR